MKIGFIGLGKLGLPCALAIEQKGHEIIGYDNSDRVVDIVRSKNLPYKEEGAQEALNQSNIRLASLADVVAVAEILFVAIQTPHESWAEGVTRLPKARADFDYSHLKRGLTEITEEVAKLDEDRVVVIMSTVLPGTVKREIKPFLSDRVKICYNPFFIAMGTTMRDFLAPEFVLLGVDNSRATTEVELFYRTIHDAPVFRTTIENAELIKVAYNTYIGMKIVFANTLMEICHKMELDVDAVTNALKMANDRLISGKYLSGGMGDGGGCHPRDNIALSWLAQKLDLSYDLSGSLINAREAQTEWLANLMEEHALPKVILGKSFKAESNLTVGSPSILLKNILEDRGNQVEMYDPYVDSHAPSFAPSVFLVGTKHPDFATWDFPSGSVIIDPWRYIPDKASCLVIRLGGPLS